MLSTANYYQYQEILISFQRHLLRYKQMSLEEVSVVVLTRRDGGVAKALLDEGKFTEFVNSYSHTA